MSELIKQEGFAQVETRGQGETASTTMAAQAKAAIEARWIVAMRSRRDLDQVRVEVMRECKRPSFAAVARYRKPVGEGIEGLSIRFVETALAAMGNIDATASTIYDDSEKRIIDVCVMDLEKNIAHRKQITVSKHVERRQLRSGQVPISKRTNAGGQTVYIVEASDDDLANKEAALVSKAMRTCGLRLIPGWIQDEADAVIQETMRDAAAKDPDAERRRMVDAFDSIGVSPKDLAEYLGHDLVKTTPAQLTELRAMYTAIKDGHATWADWMGRGEAKGTDAKGMEATKKLIGGGK